MSLIAVLIWLLVFALIVWIAFWILDQLPLPGPAGLIARVILGVIFLIILLTKFLPMLGGPSLRLTGL